MIISRANPRIKEIRSLKEPKALKKSEFFYMEGLRIIGEAFEKKAGVQTLVVAPELLKAAYGTELIHQAENQGIEQLEVSADVFKSFAHKENPQGLAAIGIQRFAKLEALNAAEKVIVALTEVADPGNLGTILRTADATGCGGIVLLGDCVSPYETGAMRASMGAIFSQPVVQTDFDSLLRWKKAQGCRLIGTADSAQLDYAAVDYAGPLILLMGSERQGLSDAVTAACDQMARIPMMGSSDSLNLAVATGVMLYQIFNSRRGGVQFEI